MRNVKVTGAKGKAKTTAFQVVSQIYLVLSERHNCYVRSSKSFFSHMKVLFHTILVRSSLGVGKQKQNLIGSEVKESSSLLKNKIYLSGKEDRSPEGTEALPPSPQALGSEQPGKAGWCLKSVSSRSRSAHTLSHLRIAREGAEQKKTISICSRSLRI